MNNNSSGGGRQLLPQQREWRLHEQHTQHQGRETRGVTAVAGKGAAAAVGVFSYYKQIWQVWKTLNNSSRGGRHREQTTTATEKHRAQLTSTSFLEREGHGTDIDRPGATFTVFGPI